MALTLEQKQQVVAEVSEVAANAYSAVAAEYHGIGVAQLTELRVQAREKGVVLKVVKAPVHGSGFAESTMLFVCDCASISRMKLVE